MRVTKWGDSLAVRIPVEVADALHLKEGDDVELLISKDNGVGETTDAERQRALEYIRAQKWEFPPGWKFDRDEANER